jgi:hypothetical protein
MRKKSFTVDLTKIKGGGEFQCPSCDNLISPDDESEETYTIIETVMGDEDYLERMVIQCSTCNNIINLEGFEALSEEEDVGIEVSEALPESKTGYRTLHTISQEDRSLGQVTVEYAQKEDVKAFKRFRKLRLGEPFKATVTLVNAEEASFKREDLQPIAKVVKKRFKGLVNQDIYIIEEKDGRKNVIGKASDF